MRVWVDIESGTWGDATNIRILNVDDEKVEEFAELPDSDRSGAARYYGWAINFGDF
jgi:hypothetical protein